MNNCIHLKNRSGKPFCKLHKEITFEDCKTCDDKEYKTYKSIRKIMNKATRVKHSTYDTVYSRDKGVCRLCKQVPIQLHHIKYRSENKDLINDIDNCIMLCVHCHNEVHSNKKKWQPILLGLIENEK